MRVDSAKDYSVNDLFKGLCSAEDCRALEYLSELLPCGVMICRHDGVYSFLYFNDVFAEMIGYTREEVAELYHNNLSELIFEEDIEKTASEISYQAIKYKRLNFNYRVHTKDGNGIWLFDSSRLIKIDGNDYFFCMVVDISDHKNEIYTLTEKSERDALTGLYNRLSGQTLIEDYLKSVHTGYGAFILLDIDFFKEINDTHGHLFGDTILSELGYLLIRQFRATDIVCRMGGDEFIVFMKDLPSIKFAEDKANEVLQAVFELSSIKTNVLTVSCSMGIAVYPGDGTDFISLYKKADEALYNAKATGRGKAVMFQDVGGVNDANMLSASAVDGVNNFSASVNNDSSLIRYAFNLLFNSKNIIESINLLFRVVGRHFDVSRVYIFEDRDDGLHITNTVEWCNEGVLPEIENLKMLPVSMLQVYYDKIDETNGLYYCHDTSKLEKNLREILEPQGVKAMIHCALYDNGKRYGFIGFDECRNVRRWDAEVVRAINDISNVMSVFLANHRRNCPLPSLKTGASLS